MKTPSEEDGTPENGPEELRDRLMGLGERSMRKSYFPELQKRMEELERTWGSLNAIVDAMPSIIVGVNEKLEVTLANAHMARFAKVDPEEVKGRAAGDILFPIPGVVQALAETIKDKKTRTLRKLLVAGQSTPSWYDATIFPLSQDSPEAVARIDDVTARVRMEEVLMQTEKMLSVGALAAGMAHEINNPLAGILQGAQSVIRRFSPDLPANRKAAERLGIDIGLLELYLKERDILTLLDSIKDSGVRASRIVTNILEFSRRSDMSKALVSLPQLVDKALELALSEFDLKRKFDFRHILIVREDDPALPSVWCVPTQIEQVILNLLKNAAQALTSSATQTPTITIRTGQSEGMAMVEVEDNGPGMEESLKERVFEPFFTTKAPGEGTGLGLSVVYYIVVEQHEGRVSVRTAPGKGTAIGIKLPLKTI